jgi:hypothetical protein
MVLWDPGPTPIRTDFFSLAGFGVVTHLSDFVLLVSRVIKFVRARNFLDHSIIFCEGAVFTPDLGTISTNSGAKAHLWHPLLNLAE